MTGCASITYTARIDARGVYRDPVELQEKARNLDGSDVKVVIGDVPAELGKEGVDYQILGQVSALENNPFMNIIGWWVYDYAPGERWRYGYCGAQVPLNWVTLGMWGIFTPFHYPCKNPVAPGEDAIAKQTLATLRSATKALGGNVVLTVGVGLELGTTGFAIKADPAKVAALH
jgi:hypothetical protein